MTIDENTRLDLRQWFEQHMGERLAHAVMEAMPPIDHDQLATKADVAILCRELRAEMSELRSELRGEMSELRSELRGEMTELRGEMTGLRGEMTGLRGEMTGLRGELHLELAGAVRLLVTMQIMSFGATMAAIVGLAAYLAP